MSKQLTKQCLCCPHCKNEHLLFTSENIYCESCKHNYPIENGKKYLFRESNQEETSDEFDKIKLKIKKFNTLYNFIIFLFSPVYTGEKFKLKKIIHTCKKKTKEPVILNLGSGNTNISDDVSNIDIINYPNVDLTSDISKLPIKDNSIDLIINIAVLEHIENPEKVVGEMFRVLKKGGQIYSFFPFIQGFHASPHDYSRRTVEGMKVLFEEFNTLRLESAGGPTSGFLWVFQEWLALVLSFGIVPLYRILHLIIMCLTFPIKFIDVLLNKHPMAKNITSGFIFIGKK